MKKFLLLGVLAMLPSMAAHADIIPTNDAVTGGPGDFTWNYHIIVTQDETAFPGPAPSGNPVTRSDNTGAFFTIYDFTGYINGTCVSPTGWSCSVQNVGYTPNDVLPGDSGSVVNLTWSYNNTDAGPIVGLQTITGFSANSTQTIGQQISFAARATKNTGDQAGTFVDNVGLVEGPASLPEPASLGLLGLAFAGLAARRRRA